MSFDFPRAVAINSSEQRFPTAWKSKCKNRNKSANCKAGIDKIKARFRKSSTTP